MKQPPRCQQRNVRLVRNVRRLLSDQAVMERPEFYPAKLPSSTRRHVPIWPSQQGYPLKQPAKQKAQTQPGKQTRTFALLSDHPVRSFGIGMLLMLLLWQASLSALSFWQSFQDDLHYGFPRTYQTDVRVGHHDNETASHFVAINLNKQITILEFPGGDLSKAISYQGPVLLGEGQEKTPATLEFADLDGDGKLDMILVVKATRYPFRNDGTTFHPVADLRTWK